MELLVFGMGKCCIQCYLCKRKMVYFSHVKFWYSFLCLYWNIWTILYLWWDFVKTKNWDMECWILYMLININILELCVTFPGKQTYPRELLVGNINKKTIIYRNQVESNWVEVPKSHNISISKKTNSPPQPH